MPITEEQMKRTAATFSKNDKQPHNGKNNMDVAAYAAKYNINIIKEKLNGSSTLYCLKYCIFDRSHNNNESAIGQTTDGKLFYQCFHNSCKGRTWQDARQIISGNDSLTDFHPRILKTTKDGSKCNETVNLVCASNIEPESVSWVWTGYIAQGKMHVIVGPSGHGKTTVLLALGATITIGGRWPDGSRAEVGDIAIWSGEDDPADTIVPRLISCGADLERVHIINGVVAGSEQRSFDPSADMPLLRESMWGKNIKMLIIDPIVSAVGGDSHKNAETRRALQPVVDLAAEIDCAVYGVTHFTKGTAGRDPVERVTGSLAFGALTRIVIVAMKLPDGGEHPAGARLFARAKSNVGPDGGGFYYFLEVGEVPGHEGIFNTRVLWGGSVDGTAKELIAKAEMTGDDQDMTGDAAEWLKDVLSDGPVLAGKVLTAAKKMGYTKTTIHRARIRLKIKSTKLGFATGWGWRLPEESTEDSTTEDSTKNPIHLGTEPSREKERQVVDIVEDSTKVPHGQKKGYLEPSKNPRRFQGVEPSDGALTGKGLGGLEPPKVPSPRVRTLLGHDGAFAEDEVII